MQRGHTKVRSMRVRETKERAASVKGHAQLGERRGEAARGGLLTAQKVAELLGVSPEYVWQMSREGRIPTIRLGRARRYRLDSILSWLEEIESRDMPSR